MEKTRTVEKRAEMLEAEADVLDGTYETGHQCGELPLREDEPIPEFSTIIEQVVERENMQRAYSRVMRNKGCAGIDKMPVEQLKAHLDKHWAKIKGQLLAGSYQPEGVREVNIPKAKGGMRQLGIPTVVDRLIQQALQQVLSRVFDPRFSEFSYGFRAKQSAHKAITQSQEYQKSGRRWVVDIDLAKFFDEVNHQRLLSRVGHRMKDRKVLQLIRWYLRAGVMRDGVHTLQEKGTPQGGPLSPLLSNIVLDELDKELEKRQLKFCRYADDCQVYVRSKKAAERVMESMKRFIEETLRLKVNTKKSVVSRPWKRTFLGYSFTHHKQPKVRVPRETVQKLKGKLVKLFCKGRGRNLRRFIEEILSPKLRGWMSYFKLAEVKQFAEKLDEWIRRRLRLIIWRQWKRPRRRLKGMLQAGLSEKRAKKSALNGRGPWWNSGASHMNAAFQKTFFERLGLVSLQKKLEELRKKNINN